MHDQYLFGKDFQREFIALENNKPVKLPTQTSLTIYYFTAKPNRTEAAAGTGAIASAITSWTQDEGSPYKTQWTVTAIADPAATSDVDTRWYWESINYITKTGGTTTTKVRAFKLARAAAPSTYPKITTIDLIEVYPAIASYLKEDQLNSVIDNCLEEMILDLERDGLEFGKFTDLKKLRLPLAFKCIAESCLSQIEAEGDAFEYRYKEFNKKYAEKLRAITLPYDDDGDGQAELEQKPKRNYWIMDT